MGTKLKERIIDWAQKTGREFKWLEMAVSLGVPRGSATGRLCELAKAGVLVRGEDGYRLKTQAPAAAAHFELLVDRSGSMGGSKWHKALYLLKAKLAALAKSSPGSTARVSAFDDKHDIGFVMSVTDPFKQPEYTGGGTHLWDAITMAYNRLQAGINVVFVITDGIDEHSKYQTVGSVKTLLESRNNVTLVLLVPPGQKAYLKTQGFPEGNILEWDAANIEAVAVKATAAAVAHVRSGVRTTKNYFKADLSRTTIVDFERDLKEVTGQARRWVTPTETTTEKLISERTKQPYEPGTGYFEVMKREGKIKADRRFLILEPTSGRVFADGRRTVRQVCGYPDGDVAVKPGNHAGFVLLCQSKSSSKDTFRARILPRGTNVVHYAGR